MKTAKLPSFFQSIFWDTRLANIDPKKHSRYIIERVLQWGRPHHVRWMLGHYSKRMILQVAKTGREVTDKNRNFWYVYLTRRHHAPRRTGARYQHSIWQNRSGDRMGNEIYPISKIEIKNKRDLVAMGLGSIASRGTKRDFIDLYVLLSENHWTVTQAIEWFKKRYKGMNLNLVHLLKSLLYFDDADNEQIEMITPVDWDKIKQYFRDAVKAIEL